MEVPKLSGLETIPVSKSQRRPPRMSFSDPPPSPRQNDECSHLIDEAKLFSAQYIMSIFNGHDIEAVKHYTQEITHYLHNVDENGLKEISQNQEIIDTIISKFNELETVDDVETYTHATYPFLKANPEGFIDSGLLFALQGRFNEFALQILDFYQIIPVISSYGRDSMISLGMINDVINFCSNAKTHEERIIAAHVLNAQFTIESCFQVDTILPLIPELVNLLPIVQDDYEVTSIVLYALSEINGREQSLSWEFFKLDVQSFLVKNIEIPELTSACLNLAGNMSICNTEGVTILIKDHLVQKVMDFMGTKHSADVFFVLSNLVESSPEDIAPFLTKEFVEKSVIAACGDSAKDPSITDANTSVLDEGAYFFSTCLMFLPSRSLGPFLRNDVVKSVKGALAKGGVEGTARALDAISRLIIVLDGDEEARARLKRIDNRKTRERLEGLRAQKEHLVLADQASYILRQVSAWQ